MWIRHVELWLRQLKSGLIVEYLSHAAAVFGWNRGTAWGIAWRYWADVCGGPGSFKATSDMGSFITQVLSKLPFFSSHSIKYNKCGYIFYLFIFKVTGDKS